MNIPKKQETFNDFLDRMKILIDLLSDADFRIKFPEFVEKHRVTIEQAQNLCGIIASEQMDITDTLQGQIQNQIRKLEDMKQDIPPDYHADVDAVISRLKAFLNN